MHGFTPTWERAVLLDALCARLDELDPEHHRQSEYETLVGEAEQVKRSELKVLVCEVLGY